MSSRVRGALAWLLLAAASGGLLIAIHESRLRDLIGVLQEHETLAAAVIGDCTADDPGIVKVS